MRISLSQHIEKWKDCTRCHLHEGRLYTVFSRGKLPCDVLLCGEGPGESEDSIGRPFCGPAGRKLDEILEYAIPQGITYAITNLVLCIPRDEETGKTKEPDAKAVKACEPRLLEFIQIAQPKLIVCLGKAAEKYLQKKSALQLRVPSTIDIVSTLHPSHIIQAEEPAQPLLTKRVIVDIQTALTKLGLGN